MTTLNKEIEFLSGLSEKANGNRADQPIECIHTKEYNIIAIEREKTFFDKTIPDEEKKRIFTEMDEAIVILKHFCKCK